MVRETELTRLRRGLAAKRTDDAVPTGYEAIRTAAASGVFDLRVLAARLLEGRSRADSGRFMSLPFGPMAEQVTPVEAPPTRSAWLAVGLAGVGLLTATALVLTGVALAVYFQPTPAPQAPASTPIRSAIRPAETAPMTVATPAVASPQQTDEEPELELAPVTVATRPAMTRPANAVAMHRGRAIATAPPRRPVTMAATSREASVARLLAAAQKRAARNNRTEGDPANLPTHLSRASMARSLSRLHGPAKRCFKRGNIMAARTSVRLRIQGSTGRVAHAEVIGKWSNSVPGRCLSRAARSLRFGRFTGTTQTVLYPIIIR